MSTPVTSKIRRGAAVAALLLSTACGSKTRPTPIPDMTLTCPADVRVGSVATPTATVTFALPTAIGGKPPISVTCSPQSEASFPLGTTPVACTGTDGVRLATCSFKVTLVPPQPVLAVQRFPALGDSITAGEDGEAAPMFSDEPHSYSWLVAGLLAARYTTQSPLVTDCGIPGEHASKGALRIDAVLDQKKPDVLMLLEGVNDLSGHLSDDRNAIIEALAYDIGAAKRRGLAGVFLSTLLPQNPAGLRSHDVGELVPVNDSIRALAIRQGAILVDNYAVMAGHPEYIDTDGLHPNAAGNQVIAGQFFAAIPPRFETFPPTSVAGGAPLGVPVDSLGCFDVPSVTSTGRAGSMR